MATIQEIMTKEYSPQKFVKNEEKHDLNEENKPEERQEAKEERWR